MSYMWTEFNIKTFPAETAVFRDGVFCPELSTLGNTKIDRTYDLPVHIIYIGDLAGKNELNIDISANNQKVFLSARVKNKKPAFLNIFIKNTGKNSELRGHVMVQNFDNFSFDCTAHHAAPDTGILVNTKLLGHKNSVSCLCGVAVIDKNCDGAVSDIGFTAMAAPGARIEFRPEQRISAAVQSAQHSAAIYRPGAPQIEFLREGGLSGAEIKDVLQDAFLNDFSLF